MELLVQFLFLIIYYLNGYLFISLCDVLRVFLKYNIFCVIHFLKNIFYKTELYLCKNVTERKREK
jgi:hypothetical protein